MSIAKKFLYPGDVHVSKSKMHLKTVLGSCIAVCLYDGKLKRGGMNHFVHAYSNGEKKGNKYGDISMTELINSLLESGSSCTDLIASVYGGASGHWNSSIEPPGSLNKKIALKILGDYGIPVISEDTGGCFGRTVIFNTESNEISVEKLQSCLRQCSRDTCKQAI